MKRRVWWASLVVVSVIAIQGCGRQPGPASTGSLPPGARSLANPPVIAYDTAPRAIPIPQPTPKLAARFSGAARGEVVTVQKPDGRKYSGHITDNAAFYREVMRPALEPHVEELRALDPVERINVLALFGHETYRTWFGRDAFAWGGHLHDLDDPQEEGPNFDHRYGFDCSGFAAMPYEVALDLGLMAPEDPPAVLTAAGWERNATAIGLADTGGRGGTSNRWRVDTGDMEHIGSVVTNIPKGGVATADQLAAMQPGDIVLAPGHVGLVVELAGEKCYLEHGGWVCPPNGGLPFKLGPALAIFAEVAPLTIRRVLPDRSR